MTIAGSLASKNYSFHNEAYVCKSLQDSTNASAWKEKINDEKNE